MYNVNATTKLMRARTALLEDQPWFGAQAMHLELEAVDGIPTVRTDGTRLQYNLEFVMSQSDAVLRTIVAHEVGHCSLGHIWRRGGRNSERWNEAGDYVINDILLEAGFVPVPGWLWDRRFRGLSVEPVYAQLERERVVQPQPDQNGQGGQPQPQGGGQPGQGQGGQPQPQGQPQGQPQPDQNGQPLATGDFCDPPEPDGGISEGDGDAMTETDWQIAAEQAMRVALRAGKMPGGAQRAMEASKKGRVPWREALRQLLQLVMPSDYSWTNPNRRFLNQGLVLPGVVKRPDFEIVVGCDTSGSVGAAMLRMFGEEITSLIAEMQPSKLTVVYADSQVQHTETFLPGDSVVFHPKGGGGTRFGPVFDWVTENVSNPAALVYLTDLENDPSEVLSLPAYPVLWAVPEWVTKLGSFGETVRVSAYD